MPGGLMQLTAFGAQNVLINGNPSMSYFTKLYKRTTNFAMEHFRLEPRNVTDTGLPQAGKRTFRFKVPNYAGLKVGLDHPLLTTDTEFYVIEAVYYMAFKAPK